jgi:hypothetical protein
MIAELLGMSEDKYQLHVFTIYTFWCDLNSQNQKELQKLVSNNKLYKWFLGKHQSLELIFYDQIGGQQLTVRQKIEMHAAATKQIANYYPPKNIISKIKKQSLNS